MCLVSSITLLPALLQIFVVRPEERAGARALAVAPVSPVDIKVKSPK